MLPDHKVPRRPAHRRRRLNRMPATLVVGLILAVAACTGATPSGGSASTVPTPTPSGPEPRQIVALAQDAMAKYHLKGLIVRVTTNGQNTYTGALGESMTGVPATIDMHVRNGF